MIKRESASGIGTFLAQNIQGRYLATDLEIDGKVATSQAGGRVASDANDAAAEARHRVYRNQLRALRGHLAADLAGVSDLATLGTWKPPYGVEP